MSYRRLTAAAVAGTVVYFALGFAVFGKFIAADYRPYSAVYRPAQEILRVFPIGIAATFVGIFVLAAMYAKSYRRGSGASEGARFGALVGVFAVCAFVLHNYVNLNIGIKLTVEQAIGYFIEWLAVGVVFGLTYKSAPETHGRR